MNKKDKIKKIRKLIAYNDVAKKHFYKEIDDTWLLELDSEGMFTLEDSLSVVSSEGYYPDWIEGRYLSRISNIKPSEVLKILEELDTKDHTNPIIFEVYIEVLSNIADAVDISELIKKIVENKWIGNKGRVTFLSYKIKDLFSKLVETNQFDNIILILKEVLKFNLPDDYLEKSKERFIQPIPRIESYTLEEILKELTTIKFDEAEELKQILEVLTSGFNEHLNLARKVKDYTNEDPFEDYSFIWKSGIDYDKDRLHDIKEDFVIAIRDIIKNNSHLVSADIIGLFDKYNKRIFERIKLFSLSHKDLTIDEKVIVDTIIKNIPDRHNIHELRKLLASKYQRISTTNQKKILDQIKESFADRDDNIQIANKADLIKPIAEHLSKSEKELFEEVIQSKAEYVPSYRFSGMRSGPNSNYSREEIESISHEDRVNIFRKDEEWFYENTHNNEMYSPRGSGRLWQAIVADNHKEYINNLKIYNPKELLPLYIYHLLNGIELKSDEFTNTEWKKVISYVEWILKIYKEDKIHKPKSNDSFDVGDKEEILMAILRLMENGFKGKGLYPKALKDRVWKIITEIYSTYAELDETFVEENDKDYFTHSINSIGGLILHNVYYYGFWVIDQSENKVYPDEVVGFLSTFLEKHPDYKTGKSVMGKYLPWTQRFSGTLFNKQKNTLLPKDNMSVRYIAWETYLANTIFREAYQELREIYELSIKELASDIPDRRYWADPKNTLLEHIIVGYIHSLDKPGLDKTLFDLLLETKGIDDIAYAIDFVGRAYISSDNPKKQNLGKKELERICSIWETVLNKKLDSKVFENFGWWIKKGYFDDNWLLDKLISTLKKSNGHIDPDFKVLEQLTLLADKFPKQVGEVLELMVKSTNKEKTYYFRDKEIMLIIEKLEVSDDEEAKQHAKEIRDTLVGYGFTKYTK